jgi:hypothetical protein
MLDAKAFKLFTAAADRPQHVADVSRLEDQVPGIVKLAFS